jgi:hypothetical protein
MELFHPPPKVPEPAQEISQKLQRLLVRMLREHIARPSPSSGGSKEVDNE